MINLVSGRIVWVGEGRGQGSLKPFWKLLRRSKAKIRAVCCDLSAGYWGSVIEHLPKATVVFERFHLMKLMNEKLDELRRELWREAEGLMKKAIKGTRYLLLMNQEKLSEEQLPSLEEALRANEPLWKGHLMKEYLRLLWEQPSQKEMKKMLEKWCVLAMCSGVKQLKKMANTLLKHAFGILSWWKHRISNGRMEGINNKIKAMLRQHYGLRDEEFFKLKLYGLHESKFTLTGC